MRPVTATVTSTAPRTVTSDPCPYRARAWWGEQLVAESAAAVRVLEADQPPALYFPAADVRFELFRAEDRRLTCPVKGSGRLWTIEGTVRPDRSAWGASDDHPPAGEPSTGEASTGEALTDGIPPTDGIALGGRDVLWRFSDPAPGLGWLSALAAFDHERVRVELVDAADGDDPRDVTTKRFPTWGDAADLIDIMDVRPAGERRYVSVARADHRRGIVEGSQLLGQAIVAATRHAPGRRVVSAHLVFYRAADAHQPLEFELEELSAGRTFTTLAVHVSQDGRRRASGTLLLDVTAGDLIRHRDAPPPCAGPYDSEPYDMAVTGRDIRMVDGAYSDDPDAPVGPPVIDTWVRFRRVPADPALHAGLLTQFTGHISIAAALRAHAGVGQRQAHRTLSMGINAIAISLHTDVRADHWMRYHHRSTFAGDGMTHSECRVYREGGDLLASFSVDAMVRGLTVTGRVDDRVAL